MPLRGLALAFFLTAAALFLTYAIPPLREGSPFLLPLTAVLLSVWYSGLGPGLLAGTVAALLLAYLFLPPPYSLPLHQADLIRLGVFLELASAWCVFIAMHRRQDSARARLLAEAAEERRQAEQRVATTTQELRSSLRVLRAYVQALARELEAPAPDLTLMRQLTEQMEGTLAQVEAFVNRLAASPRE